MYSDYKHVELKVGQDNYTVCNYKFKGNFTVSRLYSEIVKLISLQDLYKLLGFTVNDFEIDFHISHQYFKL